MARTMEQETSVIPGADFREIKRERVSDAVYEMIRNSIINQTLTPGQKLNPDDLARRMGVSRTPVTEALNRLAEEELVEIIPRKGTFVTELSVNDVAETFDVRRALELLAAETAVQHVTAEELAELRALAEKLTAPVENEQDVQTHLSNNLALHERLVALSRNRKLMHVYRNLNAHIRIARAHCASAGDWKHRLQQEYEEHKAILAALEARDAEALKKALNAHLLRAKESLLADLERQK